MIQAYGEFFPTLGDRVYIAPSADVIGQISLGEDASIFFQCVLRADINAIRIGNRSNIQDHTTVHVASDLAATIGDDVSIGHGCIIHACAISNRVLVGMGSIIMDGVLIGENCLVGAGSLLPKGKIYEAGSLILGNPARVARRLTAGEIAGIAKLAVKYVGVKNTYLASK